MSTIKDVARIAGVSFTTVSHVLNKSRYVSPELTTRIYAAMEELNYHPNSLARSLRGVQTRTVALMIPDNSNPYFAEMARVVEDVGFEIGYSVILCNSDNKIEKEKAYIDVLISKKVDGVIVIAASNEFAHLQTLHEQGIPTVNVDRATPGSSGKTFLVNDEHGGFLATEYLINLGHKKIAFINGPFQPTEFGSYCLVGYERAMKNASLPILPGFVVNGRFTAASGNEAMNQLLKLPARPTAVFIANDMMAIGALSALYASHIAVPDQISIVGFDDIPIASTMIPPLTTIAQPYAEVARNAFRELIAKIEHQDQTEDTGIVMFEPKLVIRESSSHPPTVN